MQQTKRLARVDGLRALAAVAVLMLHGQILRPESASPLLAHYGHFGVPLFFFISGYVISLSWVEGSTTAADFYWRRIKRLAPLYYFLLVLTYVFSWSNDPTTDLNITNFVLHLFVMHGFSSAHAQAGIGPMWSLTSEICFYLLFPLIRRLPTPWLIVALVISLQTPEQPHIGWFNLTPFAAIKWFAVGMLVHRHRDWFEQPAAKVVSGSFALLFVIASVARVYVIPLPFDAPSQHTLLLFSCPWLLLSSSRVVGAVLDNAVSGFIGLISYSVYLWQMPIMFEIMKAEQRMGASLTAPLMVTLYVGIVVAVSALSYCAIERPFLAGRKAATPPPTRSPHPKERADEAQEAIRQQSKLPA